MLALGIAEEMSDATWNVEGVRGFTRRPAGSCTSAEGLLTKCVMKKETSGLVS
jgi:hypothetical protein